MERIFIDKLSQLQELAERALEQPRIAVDLESDGLFRYRPQLCTLQLRVDDTLAVIDALAVPDLLPLAPVLDKAGPLKVIHDLSFDARILRSQGLFVGNVFDTALAARLLGMPATGLAALLKTCCDTVVNKELQQYDWGKRPLEPHTVDYLYEDVAHLFALQDALQTQIEEQEIVAELEAETLYSLGQALAEPNRASRPAWLKVKRAQHLGPLEQAVLRELCLLREELAASKNVPPFRILHDRTLLSLAQVRPQQPAALRRGPHRLPASAQAMGPAILEAIARGIRRQAPPAEDLATIPSAPSVEERATRRRVEKALATWRKNEATQRAVDSQVVLPGHALHELANHRPQNEAELRTLHGLGQVRIDRYGATWLQLITEHGQPD